MKPNDQLGRFITPAEVRLVRTLPGPIERVWSYLVDPEKRARWFAGGPMELRVGGRITFHVRHRNLAPDETPPAEHKESHDSGRTMSGTVTRCEPPRALAFTFAHYGKSEATFELTPQGENVLLVLTHRGAGGDLSYMIGFGAGWHTHLAHLVALLESSPRPPFWPLHAQLHEEYEKLYAAAKGEAVAMIKPVQAVVIHRFSVSAERVFDAWLDVTLIGRWMFGPAVRDERIVRIALEPRVGGKFSFVVDRQGTKVDHVGEYLEIDRPRLLVFTWATRDSLPDTSRIIVEITPLDRGCEVKVTHVMNPKWADFTDKAAGSWAKMLTALEKMFTPPGRAAASPAPATHVSH